MLNFWLISWFKLMDVFNTLVYLYKFTLSCSVVCTLAYVAFVVCTYVTFVSF